MPWMLAVATSTTVLVLSVASAAAVLAPVLWWARRRARRQGSDRAGGTLHLVDALVAVLLAGIVVVAQLWVGLSSGQSSWKLLSVLFYDVAIALPLVGVAVIGGHLLSDRWATPRATGPVLVLAGLGLLGAPIGWWMVHVEPYDVRLEHEDVALDEARAGSDPIRIGVLSDIQTTNIGRHERAAVALVAEQQPDIVVIAGDLFQGSPAQLAANRDELREVFAQLDAPGGLYVVEGDVDGPNDLPGLVEGTPAQLLVDDVVTIQVGDRTVRLGGGSLEPTGAGDAVVSELVARPEGDVGVLVAHRPEWVFRVPDGAVDLVVAGHTHGGQIQLPVVGPLTVASPVPRSVGAGGVHDVGGTPLYVSTGIGREQQGAPQVRLLAEPTVAIITLTAP